MCDTDTANLPINQRIKLIREALKLNQRDFSTYLSLSKGYIGGVEAGITKVNGRLVKLIASEFGVNEEWLTTGTGQMFTRKDDAKFTRLVSLFRELPPKYQTVIFKMIEVLLKADGEE